MLRPLSQHLRDVLTLAEAIAAELGQEFVGSEHLLLALARHGENAAAQILAEDGITEQRIHDALMAIVTERLSATTVFQAVPGSPRAKRVAHRAVELADQEDASHVDTIHLLDAMRDEVGCTAQQVLERLSSTEVDVA